MPRRPFDPVVRSSTRHLAAIEALSVRQDAHEERMDGFDKKLDQLGANQERGFAAVLERMEQKDSSARAELSRLQQHTEDQQSAMHRENLSARRFKAGNAMGWAGAGVVLLLALLGWVNSYNEKLLALTKKDAEMAVAVINQRLDDEAKMTEIRQGLPDWRLKELEAKIAPAPK